MLIDMGKGIKKPGARAGSTSKSEIVSLSSKCLQCQEPSCTGGCPIGVGISSVLSLLTSGRLEEAAALIRLRSPLASITGRLCPSDRFCERACTLARKGVAFSIHDVEILLGDFSLYMPVKSSKNAKGRILVVGSGPAGLMAAHDLHLEGFRVTVYEKEPKLGGWLRELPTDALPMGILDSEIARLARSGIEFKASHPFEAGDGFPPKGYYAMVLATGPLIAPGNPYPLLRSEEGFIIVDEQHKTSKPFVYAAGGATTRYNSITEAMASAREMAGNILRGYLFSSL
jgi:NADPH-dependent 2,4-dienoyl-CoA reductase/sulfur reductase-like enzyme